MWKCQTCETICNGGTHCSVCGAKRADNTYPAPTQSPQPPRQSCEMPSYNNYGSIPRSETMPLEKAGADGNCLVPKIAIIAIALVLVTILATIGILLCQAEPDSSHKGTKTEQRINSLSNHTPGSDTEDSDLLDIPEEEVIKPQETPVPTPQPKATPKPTVKPTAKPTPKPTVKPTITPAPTKVPTSAATLRYGQDYIGMTKKEIEATGAIMKEQTYFEGAVFFYFENIKAELTFDGLEEDFNKVPDNAVCTGVLTTFNRLGDFTENTITPDALAEHFGSKANVEYDDEFWCSYVCDFSTPSCGIIALFEKENTIADNDLIWICDITD